MDKKVLVENEVNATLGLLDDHVKIIGSPGFDSRIAARALNISRQDRMALKYKICALAAVLVVTFVNGFAIARAMEQSENYQSAVTNVMVANFEQNRIGVFWPIK